MLCDGRLQGFDGNEEFRIQSGQARIKNPQLGGSFPFRSLRILRDLWMRESRKAAGAEFSNSERAMQSSFE